jgi:hypothetical protein
VNTILTRISRARSKLKKISAPSQHYSSNSLWTDYEQARNWLRCKKLPSDIDPHAVFCNNHIDLQEVEVYGFDYDYTLKGVEYLFQDIAKEHLVSKMAILKVYSSHQIQLGTVHRENITAHHRKQ